MRLAFRSSCIIVCEVRSDTGGVLFFVGVWLSGAIAIAIIAKKLGRRWFIWGAFAFVFGPYGFLVVGLVLMMVQEKSSEKMCPRCAMEIKAVAQLCIYCGNEFTDTLDGNP